MKKLSVYITLGLLMMFTAPAYLNAAGPGITDPAPVDSAKNMTPEEVETMLNRINEIKDMDKSELSRPERKALRKEVREMKKEMREAGNGGLFISTGAIIVILLLIIIL